MAEVLPNISENLSILSERIQNAVARRNVVSTVVLNLPFEEAGGVAKTAFSILRSFRRL